MASHTGCASVRPILVALLSFSIIGCRHAPVPPAAPLGPVGTYAASAGLQITVFDPDGSRTLTRGHRDWKPVWNLAGDRLAFFRTSKDGGPFITWQSTLMVVAADGSFERALTDGAGRDFNPTWTRDGTDRIVFNRYGVAGEPDRCEVWSIAPDGTPGSEVRLSSGDDRYQWVNAALRDGRLFVDTIDFRRFSPKARSFLVTPGRPGAAARYEELERPTTHMWHKLSVSPSERRVVYMQDRSGTLGDYSDDLIFWAELDIEGHAVRNPVPVTGSTGRRCVNEYPRWSADESLILFDSSCEGVARVFAFRLSDGATFPVSPGQREPVMFPCQQGVPQ